MFGIPTASGVEGRQRASEEEEEDDGGGGAALRPRDFFWDTVVLYVVGVILGLTAVDVVTEFVRGSEVRCYHPNRCVRAFGIPII